MAVGSATRIQVVVAGNHDRLLDHNFQEQQPQRWEQAKQAACGDGHMSHSDNEAANVNWGDVIIPPELVRHPLVFLRTQPQDLWLPTHSSVRPLRLSASSFRRRLD